MNFLNFKEEKLFGSKISIFAPSNCGTVNHESWDGRIIINPDERVLRVLDLWRRALNLPRRADDDDIAEAVTVLCSEQPQLAVSMCDQLLNRHLVEYDPIAHAVAASVIDAREGRRRRVMTFCPPGSTPEDADVLDKDNYSWYISQLKFVETFLDLEELDDALLNRVCDKYMCANPKLVVFRNPTVALFPAGWQDGILNLTCAFEIRAVLYVRWSVIRMWYGASHATMTVPSPWSTCDLSMYTGRNIENEFARLTTAWCTGNTEEWGIARVRFVHLFKHASGASLKTCVIESGEHVPTAAESAASYDRHNSLLESLFESRFGV